MGFSRVAETASAPALRDHQKKGATRKESKTT
jgi:hypothetical protein